VSLSMDLSDEALFSIFELSGKVIWEEKRSLVPGENILTITPGNIPPGFYTMRITGKTILKAARLIKR
jgi:hypothetical protein